jgi:hypothetical protein
MQQVAVHGVDPDELEPGPSASNAATMVSMARESSEIGSGSSGRNGTALGATTGQPPLLDAAQTKAAQPQHLADLARAKALLQQVAA